MKSSRTFNDYIVDKIFEEDYVQTLDVSSILFTEDVVPFAEIFKNGLKTQNSKIMLCLILSSLSYAEKSTFYNTLNRWKQSLMDFKLYSGLDQDIAYCSYTLKDTVIFAFKGSSSIKDFLYNINTVLIPVEEVKGKIHKGFYNLLMKNKTLSSISKLIFNYPASTKIIFTGHSLGGALASLMASYCQNKFGIDKISLCTFGSPRVGNSEFCESVSNCHRVVINEDPIALLPFPLRYRHLRTRKLIGSPDTFPTFSIHSHKISSYFNECLNLS